jgi:hypothetical protein
VRREFTLRLKGFHWERYKLGLRTARSLPFLVSSPKRGTGDLPSALVPYYAQPAAMTTTSPRKPLSHWLRYEQRTGEPARCGSSSPPQGDAGNAAAGWLRPLHAHRMRPSKSLIRLHPRALELMPGMAVSHSNGRRQRAEEASLVRLVIRGRQVRGGRADLVQGNGILSCVGWCR